MTRAEFREKLRARRCYIGMDLSSTKDLTAIAAVFPDDDVWVGAPDDDPHPIIGFDVLAQFWVPKDQILERSYRDRVPYDLWHKTGELIATEGPTVDYEAVRAGVKLWAAEFDLRQIAYDPWNATDLVSRLKDQDGFDCVPMGQGFNKLSAPTKALEKAILSRALRHDGHPILRWNVSNVAVETDAAGNIKISKKVSTEKIDGVAALVMAVDLMDRNRHIAPPEYKVLVFGGR